MALRLTAAPRLPMLHVDIPSVPEFKDLHEARADACVSLYLPTTPLSGETDANRIELGNLARNARAQLEAVGFDKRRLAPLFEQIEDLQGDLAFWRLQASGLGVLATPDSLRTFRLADSVKAEVQVADRFHLKPLLRALTYPHSAFVLGLSENRVRLVEVFANMAATEASVPDLPADAASALGTPSLEDRGQDDRFGGTQGQNVRYRQFVRLVDNALRPVLAGRQSPLILAATGRLAPAFRQVNSYPGLLERGIEDSTDRWSLAELSAAARPLVDEAHGAQIAQFGDRFAQRGNQARTVTTLEDAARAATFGALESLLVDLDVEVPGTIDDDTGALVRAKAPGANTYGLVDEIAGRAIATGAQVLGVSGSTIPGEGQVAGTLRYPI